MRTSLHFAMSVLLCACCCQASPPTTTSEIVNASELFRWFDSIGLVELRDKPLVSMQTGDWNTNNDGKRLARRLIGFLLADDGKTFTFVTPRLDQEAFQRKPTTDPVEDVHYTPIDLREFGEEWLKAATGPQPAGPDAVSARWGATLSEPAEVFVVARACELNGLHELAGELVAAAGNLQPYADNAKNTDFPTQLANDFAVHMIWKETLDFENTNISRDQLLTEFRRFVRAFPRSKHVELATKTGDMLDRMVDEDLKHAAATTRPLAQLQPHDQIAELIFELRDQNGRQWFQPGSCDIFMDPRGEQSPAARLERLGHDAMPQLIDALTDDRFTRSVGFHRNFYFSHHVLRIGDCALAIIERIAGRGFYTRKTTNSEMMKDGETAEVNASIERWWKDVQTRGERQVLIDAVAAGEWNSISQASVLTRKYPDAAYDAIRRGISATTQPDVRVDLIHAVSAVPDVAATSLLREEMQNGADLSTRVAAASELSEHKLADEALDAMIKEWSGLNDNEPGANGLATFLATDNQPRSIDALEKRIDAHPASLRFHVVEGYFNAPPSDASGTRLTDEIGQRIERFLIHRLDDKEREWGLSGTWGNYSMQSPRICDAAAVALATRYPDIYHFDSSASVEARNRALFDAKNIWRSRHALPPLTAPATRPAGAGSGITVEIIPPIATLTPALQAAIDTLHRGPLTSKAVVDCLLEFDKSPPAGLSAMELQASRGEGSDATFQFRFAEGMQKPINDTWDCEQFMRVDCQVVVSQFGGIFMGSNAAPRDFEAVAKGIDQLNRGASTMPFELGVRVRSQ